MKIARIAGLILVASLALAPGVASADAHMKKEAEVPTGGGTPGTTKEWNQEAVAAVAAELAAEVNTLRDEVRKMPDPGVQTMQSNARMRFRDNIRRIQQTAASLSREVAGGRGHDETKDRYYRLDSLVKSAAEDGRRMDFPKPVLEQIEVVVGLLDQLDAFYH